MVQLFSFSEDVNLEDYTFLLPSVSVGNVPQLTIDLLITTFKLKKISTVWHPAIVPCVGSDPYFNSSEICTACELFINKQYKIIAMQLRSTLEDKHALCFFHNLKTELDKMRLRRIIILTSIFDYELHNVKSNTFFYISDHIKLSEEFNEFVKLKNDSNGKMYLNGGGFALKLYEILDNRQCFIVGKYVSEGDNRSDAYSLLLKVLCLCGIQEKDVEIIFPSSWQYVFGGPPPAGIF